MAEQLRPKNAGRNKSFPPRHAKRKDKYSASQQGLDKIIVARENDKERRFRPYVPSLVTIPIVETKRQNDKLREAQEKRRKANPGELSTTTDTPQPFDLTKEAEKLAKAWGLI